MILMYGVMIAMVIFLILAFLAACVAILNNKFHFIEYFKCIDTCGFIILWCLRLFIASGLIGIVYIIGVGIATIFW